MILLGQLRGATAAREMGFRAPSIGGVRPSTLAFVFAMASTFVTMQILSCGTSMAWDKEVHPLLNDRGVDLLQQWDIKWDDEIGSLEIGKKADFVLFDLDHFEWIPFHDPLQALVWSASTASIAETWVDGVPLFRDGVVVNIDERELHIEARLRAVDISKRAGLLAEDVPTTTTLYG